jgi:hypothetical protein
VDPLKPWNSKIPELLCDEKGKPLPLESEFAIPGALSAILSRKLYLGGLNRLLDNKIILPILSDYAAKFCSHELSRSGLEVAGVSLRPPESLPPVEQSLEVIDQSPKDWVIKAPNRSGGNGVHVLRTMSQAEREEVVAHARRHPEQCAFQKCVRIARIPVVVKGRHSGKLRFSNRAADLRMWVFFGSEGTHPRMTHNALVRFAPEERGSLSSIVNTSKGGGYAPFVVVDDTHSLLSISGRSAAEPVPLAPFQCEIPAFAGAEILQVSALIRDFRELIQSEDAGAHRVFEILSALKRQTREVLSFLHPSCMESLSSMLFLVERAIHPGHFVEFRMKHQSNQEELVTLLRELDSVIGEELHRGLGELRILDPDILNRGYTLEMRKDDEITLSRLNVLILKVILKHPFKRKKLKKLRDHLTEMMRIRMPMDSLNQEVRVRLNHGMDRFCHQAEERLRFSGGSSEFADEFKDPRIQKEIRLLEPLVPNRRDRPPMLATEWEFRNGRLLIDSEHVDPEIRMIRNAWLEVLERSRQMPPEKRSDFILASRVRHFERFPVLKRLQSWIDQGSNSEVLPLYELMRILPYAAYNLRQFWSRKKCQFQDLFGGELISDRIAVLSRSARARSGLSLDGFSGESFARKRRRHGLISDADRYLWISEEQSPFSQLMTIGHELIHHEQIQRVIDEEKESLGAGSIAFAGFLNSYAHFLNYAANTIEGNHSDLSRFRKPLFGLVDRMGSGQSSSLMSEMREALVHGRDAYHQVLDRYGGLYGHMMPVSIPVRVKAIKEVIPALENAKNILFAKECGLRISGDEVKSALPVANRIQCERYRNLITEAAKQWSPDLEAVRVIASHQFYGVGFSRVPFTREGVIFRSDPASIRLHQGYNQTNQQ